MGQTTNQIEHHIERTREDLGANLHELEKKVKDVTDWRYQFQHHPMTFIGAAFGGGMMLAAMFSGGRRSPRSYYNGTSSISSGRASALTPPEPARRQSSGTWDHVRDALVGVAATHVTDFVDNLLPGFASEYKNKTKDSPASSVAGL